MSFLEVYNSDHSVGLSSTWVKIGSRLNSAVHIYNVENTEVNVTYEEFPLAINQPKNKEFLIMISE